MAVSQEIIENVKQVRNAAYGKDVREAIAKGLELCYGYTSGETAIEAAERANKAAAAVEEITEESRETLEDLERAVANVDDIVKISESQPTEKENKIWIQPQSDTEYKVASFAAYEALWNRMTEIDETYQQGHGGVVSIVQDAEYEDLEDPLRRRYVVTYSDETTEDFFVNDGSTGPAGPVDQINSTTIYYHKGVYDSGSFVPTPPTDGWATDVPAMNPGEHLWTQTVISYESGAQAYIYGLTCWGNNGRDGIDGSGAVHSVQFGVNGTKLVGDAVITVDAAPTKNSNNALTSHGVYTALQSYAPLESPSLSGAPMAPNPADDNDSTRIATTHFVKEAMKNASFRRIEITMNSTALEYLDSSITTNTYCMFEGAALDAFTSALAWKTSEGKLTLTTSNAPKSSATFRVILVETIE